MTEVRDVAPGLWVWSSPHPDWTPESEFEGPVTSTRPVVGDEVVVLDPLAPEPDCDEAWGRLDAAPPTVAVVLKPDHVRGRAETPIWIADQRTLVFADALTAPHGELLVWDCPALQERALPALRALLELPFERVIVSHGQPIHDRGACERALTLPPWRG